MALLFLLVLGIICGVVANAKGRNPIGWFFLGLFFPLLAIILLICLPNLNEEKNYRQRQSRENYLLREKLLQEQLKLKSFQEHASHRLDEHDKLLNTDTRTGAPPLAKFPAQPKVYRLDDSDYHEAKNTVPKSLEDGWYYAVGSNHCGPVGKMIIQQLIDIGNIQRETLIWNEQWPDWVAAGTTKEFSIKFPA